MTTGLTAWHSIITKQERCRQSDWRPVRQASSKCAKVLVSCTQAESSSSKHASEVQALQQEVATAAKAAAESQAALKKVISRSVKFAVFYTVSGQQLHRVNRSLWPSVSLHQSLGPVYHACMPSGRSLKLLRATKFHQPVACFFLLASRHLCYCATLLMHLQGSAG